MMLKYLLITTIPSLFVLASVIWLIVALVRRSRFRKVAAGLVVVEALILVALYFHWFHPKDYPRNYLDNDPPASLTLAEAATAKNFYIGAAVGKASSPLYAEMVPTSYNSITPENATKWRRMLVNGKIGEYDFSEADAIVDYAVSKGVRVRGHTLVWGKFPGTTYPKELDERIASATDPSSELRQVMRDHITTAMTHFKGRIKTWDVVNEPMSMDGPYLDKNIYLNTLGKEYIAEAFRIAHEVDPSVSLFINEQFGNYTGEGVEVFFDLLKWLISENVPIHGVGIQAHAIFKTHNLAEFEEFVNRITDLGLFFEVTEFDARIRLFDAAADPYQAQADYMTEYARICIENPSCTGFTFWGLSDASTWFDFVPPFKWMPPNDPLLFDLNSHPKPAYFRILELLESRKGE
jgi:endo-1,4-beta-xylanase